MSKSSRHLGSDSDLVARSESSVSAHSETEDDPVPSYPQMKKSSSALDASVHVSNQGATYRISESAVAHFTYGESINQRLDKHSLDDVIRNLPRSHNAGYDMLDNANRGPCTPGTRTTILQELVHWCNLTDIPLYWLTGMLGTGKTTIAYSFCQILETANLLGASFFCSRSLPDCRDINIIIPTIAFQLAERYPPFAEALAEALHKDSDILRRSLDVQLRKLIIEPWNTKKEQLPGHVVVVLDALDECDQGHSNFLRVIFNHTTLLPFKFMMISRPEPPIRDIMINNAQVSGTLATFILHEIERDLVQQDIAKYLSSKLSPHVGSNDIRFLTELAGTLFIFAATLVRFLAARHVNLALRIELLRKSFPTNAQLKVLDLLDKLYTGVLRAAFLDRLMEEEIRELREILFMVVFAREPLTRHAIASFWMITEQEVEDRLDALRSVISFPPDRNQPLTVIHPSFQDFMHDPSRSEEFYCDPLTFNSELLRRCLALMKRELHQNICHLDGRPPNHAIDPDLIQRHISPGLRYAITYWHEHWTLSDYYEGQTVLGLVQDFITTDILHWFESLSLIGRLSVSIESLEAVQDMFTENTGLANLVQDCLEFIDHTYKIIEHSAMETYFSALTWIPSQSPMRTHYTYVCNQAPPVLCGPPTAWTGPNQIINIHSGTVHSISISRDGRYIISGSGDKTVRIWNIRSRVEECVLSGHTQIINSVMASGDGSRVISGSSDGDVRVWNIATRETIFALESNNPVSAVAMSPNDRWIASGHANGSVCVWDATDGYLIHSLKRHTHRVRSASFTPDGARLVSGSDDMTANIWNVMSGAVECILRRHTGGVSSVACSPNGNEIITGSLDKIARLWNTSGKELRILATHSDGVTCVAFTPDGKRAVTGSGDGTLRIWDVASGDMIWVLTGLEDPMQSVAVFPDGLKIAACSGDTIFIWSLRDANSIIGEEKDDSISSPNVEANSMAFSASGQYQRVLLVPSLRILDVATLEDQVVLESGDVEYTCGALSVSGSRVAASQGSWLRPTVIKLWELTGENIVAKHFTLTGHTDEIVSLSFSHDERQLVSASSDYTARVWNVATGTQIHILHHSPNSPPNSASFSHDGSQIVSAIKYAVYLWNARSGLLLHQLSIGFYVPSVAFSPDDRYIIASYSTADIEVYNAKTFELEYTHEGYTHWTMMTDGSFYALSNDGDICHFPHFEKRPHKLLWIPSQYRPKGSPSSYGRFHRPFASGPLFTLSSPGIQVCLPREHGLTTLVIPLEI